ncbi:hypothetical protein V1514DRAFT_331597 [Lipomyces japonicus]|uniref:uncharacterized protein n=1 Tax=Lipomyces japonicus TaxID=56871 RepID=UPI0034CD9272
MSSRLAQDTFISDDEEEVCPLCVEEFDISDKGFKPCPCGYQVCQFCYNNIRQNPQLNGRCPGCRRPYDDESVEYKVVTAEEWRQDHQKQTRREKEKKQKERERKEIEQASRKHLSGMRVIQKNLVYVVGLNPHIPHEELHNTLRGDQFFGQYGKIQKIVVNRRNGVTGNGGIGVYVTYYKKEDAAKCIAVVDGSVNDGKVLRAAYGTTKYCSSYLRNQPCPNPNCMFLHEPGEEADSYTRQDLSTIQHAARQGEMKPSIPRASNTSATKQPAVAARSVDENIHEADVPALPPTASWAAKASPPTQNSKPVRINITNNVPPPIRPSGATSTHESRQTFDFHSQENDDIFPKLEKLHVTNSTLQMFENAIKLLSTSSSIKFSFSSQILSKEDMISIQSMPPLFSFVSDKELINKQNLGQEDDKNSSAQARQASRHNFPEKVNNSEHLLEQQQVMQGGQASGLRTGSTPPPGLFNGPNRDGQDLFSQIVSGGRLKGQNSEIDDSLLSASTRLQQPQTQGHFIQAPISEPKLRFSDDKFPSLNDIRSLSQTPTSKASTPVQYHSSAARPPVFDDHVSLANLIPSAIINDKPLLPTLKTLSSAVSSPASSYASIASNTKLPPGINMNKILERSPSVTSVRSDAEQYLKRTGTPLSDGNSVFAAQSNEIESLKSSVGITDARHPDLVDDSTDEGNIKPKLKINDDSENLVDLLYADKSEQDSGFDDNTESLVDQQGALSRRQKKKLRKLQLQQQQRKEGCEPIRSAKSAEIVSQVEEIGSGNEMTHSSTQPLTSSEVQQEVPTESSISKVDVASMVKDVLSLFDIDKVEFFNFVGGLSNSHFEFSEVSIQEAEQYMKKQLKKNISLEELEKLWISAKKDSDASFKKFQKLLKRNRKLAGV